MMPDTIVTIGVGELQWEGRNDPTKQVQALPAAKKQIATYLATMWGSMVFVKEGYDESVEAVNKAMRIRWGQ